MRLFVHSLQVLFGAFLSSSIAWWFITGQPSLSLLLGSLCGTFAGALVAALGSLEESRR